MKNKGFLLIAVIILSSLALIYTQYPTAQQNVNEAEFFFGVSYGQMTSHEAKVLIDKVKNYTNFFLINSYDLTTNKTALNEVCDYAAKSNLKFIVYFDFISRIMYPWHQTWLDTAKERWGEMFLGIHLRDEPGGKQIDKQEFFTKAVNYTDAANQFIANLTSTNSMIDAKNKTIPIFTSDYALYWWDYLAGYDTIFAELGWNINSTQQIAFCRGAANMQGKTWGTIITWTYYEPPYLASAQEIYQDMVLSYQAGAKYVIVFNHPTYPDTNPYGILSDEHFEAMQQFWIYKEATQRVKGKVADVALVLPKDYGWGMRRTPHISNDRIWGLWPEDEKAQLILINTNKLISQYGTKLDIIFEDQRFDFTDKYSKVFFWNSSII